MVAAAPKTIHGHPVTQTAFLNEIINELSRIGGGKAVDLTGVLGPEWETKEGRRALASTLFNMRARGVLYQQDGPNERGFFYVAESTKWRGVTPFDQIEKQILDVIRDRGGFCRYRDIQEAFGVRPAGANKEAARQDSTYGRINQVIEKSVLIRQDLAIAGIYNLPWSELLTMPIAGEFTCRLVKAGYQVLSDIPGAPAYDDVVWREERDAILANIGEAFKSARAMVGWTAERLLEVDAVKAALLAMVKRGGDEVNVIRAAWNDQMMAEAKKKREAGQSTDEVSDWIEDETDRRDPQMPLLMYKRFERGSLGAHWAAPVAFYTAAAEAMGLCPASLSRGVLFMKPAADRYRPIRHARTSGELAEADRKNEAWDRAQIDTSPIPRRQTHEQPAGRVEFSRDNAPKPEKVLRPTTG